MWIITPTDLAQVVREQRRRLGWSMDALARRTGVSRQWIGMLERGKPGVGLGAVLRVMATLGLRVDVRDPSTGERPAGPSSVQPADVPDVTHGVGRPLRRLATTPSRRGPAGDASADAPESSRSRPGGRKRGGA